MTTPSLSRDSDDDEFNLPPVVSFVSRAAADACSRSAAAMSDAEILSAYPSLVYAAYDPAPAKRASPRRLLSNRWNSSVNYRSYDVRIALNLGTTAEEPDVAGSSVLKAAEASRPKAGAPSGALSARAVLQTPQQQVFDGASLPDAWPSASPEAAGIAYRAQVLADTVEGYERPARWRVPGV